MKTITRLLPLLICLFIFVYLMAGCALTPVPRTKFNLALGGQTISWDSPKQINGTNLEFEVTLTNGTSLKAKIGNISSVNDPLVIDKAYAGQAFLMQTTLNGVSQLITTAGALAAKGTVGASAQTSTNTSLFAELPGLPK